MDQQLTYLEMAVQLMLETTAQQKYDSIISCISYVGDPNTTWDTEARAFRNWRSNVWSYCYQRMQAGGAVPTSEELIADILAQYPAPW